MVHPLEFSSELRTAFEQYPGAMLAYLFGSHARQQASALSDVDIAVLLANQPDDEACFACRMEITGQVMDILRVNDVDVAVLNRAPLALRYRVVRDGRLLFCRDDDVRIEFVVRTVMAYLDFKPVVELFEKATLARAQKGELLSGYNPHRGSVERYLRRRKSAEGASTTHVR